MYKVFFNDRIVLLSRDCSDYFRNQRGLYYKYSHKDELHELITSFQNLENIDRLYICHSDKELLFDTFKSGFNYIEAAGGLVKNSNGEILFIYRLEKWDLPKGKIEKYEQPNLAAIREVEEECGIEGPEIVKPLGPTFHSYTQNNITYLKKTHWYEMFYNRHGSPAPQTEEFITDVMWVKAEELKKVVSNTYPSIIELLADNSLITTPPSNA